MTRAERKAIRQITRPYRVQIALVDKLLKRAKRLLALPKRERVTPQ